MNIYSPKICVVILLSAFLVASSKRQLGHGHVNVGSGPVWSNIVFHGNGHHYGILGKIQKYLVSKYRTTRPWKLHEIHTREVSTVSTSPSNFAAWKSRWLSYHSEICGKQEFEPNLRGIKIIGGNVAKEGSWPWMVSIVFEPFRQAICAGVLIDQDWVMTAAHCFDPPFNTDYSSNMFIRTGIHNSTYESESKAEQRRKITKVYKHPEYNGFMKTKNGEDFIFDSDIALVKLEKGVVFGDYASPLCLPTEVVQNETRCVISGWGRQKPPSDSANIVLDPTAWPQLLKQAVVPVISSGACAKETGYENKVTTNMFCAGYPDGKVDSCAGDSGGPLQCKRDGRWEAVGVTSWGGATYSECAKPHQPGVYTDVYNFRDWLLRVLYEDKMGENSL